MQHKKWHMNTRPKSKPIILIAAIDLGKGFGSQHVKQILKQVKVHKDYSGQREY